METAPSHREMNYLGDQQLGDVEGLGINPDYAFEVLPSVIKNPSLLPSGEDRFSDKIRHIASEKNGSVKVSSLHPYRTFTDDLLKRSRVPEQRRGVTRFLSL